MTDNKTTYSIEDEFDEKTTITLPKLDADVLQKNISDVHAWVQNTYNKVTQHFPKTSRRNKGNIVRVLSAKEANKYPEYKEAIFKKYGI